MHCPNCTAEVDTMYDCPDCGHEYCVDCRTPDQHSCESGNTTTESTPSRYKWYHYVVGLVVFMSAIAGGGAGGPYELLGGLIGAGLVTFAILRLTSSEPEPNTA